MRDASGLVSDISFDDITDYSKVLVPFFAKTPELENSWLLFVSKSANVRNLLELAREDPQ